MLKNQKLAPSILSLSLLFAAFVIGSFSTQKADAFDIKLKLTSSHRGARHCHTKSCYKIVPRKVYVGNGRYKVIYYRVPVCKKVVYRKSHVKKNYGHKKIIRKSCKKRIIRSRR